jgi:hypothetical protein
MKQEEYTSILADILGIIVLPTSTPMPDNRVTKEFKNEI